jgi:cell division protein FtsI/penicillin-binding protein 2
VTSRSTRTVGALLVLVLAGAVPACSSNPPDTMLNKFLSGWTKGDFTGVSTVSDAGQEFSPDGAKLKLNELTGDLTGKPVTIKLVGKPKVDKDVATAAVDVTWTVTDGVTWSYRTTVKSQLKNDRWAVFLNPSTVHPDLHASEKLALRRKAADRGPILDGTGAAIFSTGQVVTVGVLPQAVRDVNTLVGQLDAAFKAIPVVVDVSGLAAKITSAKKDAFVEVATLRRADYDKVKPQLQAAEGTRFRESSRALARTSTFARGLLGRVGPVTKEIMDKNPGKFQIGDLVGTGGLQQRYEDTLRGKAGIAVVIPGATAGAEKVLFNVDPTTGATLKTTLDIATQDAAEKALAPETAHRSSIVALRISDGAVLALANGPAAPDLNLALTAQVPPGSTLKMVTAVAALTAGTVNANTGVACPPTLTVDGATFKNSHNLTIPGAPPLHTDFARSCNTAFASLADKLGTDGLAGTAANLGIGVPWDLGADVFTGKVSAGGSKSEQAAAAFGQGTTQVSPITLAGAAAAVNRGQWKQPHLITDPAPAKPAPDGPELKPDVRAAMAAMMREVVTGGTASALKSVKGAPVYGKTGTAEFATGSTQTHSWFIGWRGDVAFAVFVESGGLSTEAAVPIAGRFFGFLG